MDAKSITKLHNKFKAEENRCKKENNFLTLVCLIEEFLQQLPEKFKEQFVERALQENHNKDLKDLNDIIRNVGSAWL